MKKNLIFILPIFILSSCGYFQSGTWEDDAKNWDRIYFEDRPDYLNIVHSKYWRSAHWSLEYVYYMQADSSEQFLQKLLKDNDKIKPQSDIAKAKESLGGKPEWFAPKSLDEYEIWESDDFWDHFILLKDKETGHLFWHDMQL